MVLGVVLVYALLNSPVTRQRPVMFLFLTSFALSAIFWKTPEVIVDASRYFTQAKHLEIYGTGYFVSEWGNNINAWTDLPLVPFLYGLIFKFFGETRAFIQVFTSFLFSLTVVFTYLIGRRLWDEETGFFGGVLLWGIPYIFSQTPLMLVDVPTMFFLVLSVYTFIKALEGGGVWVGIASAAVFCAVFSKYSAWMMLSVLAVVFLVYLFRERVGSGTWNPQPVTRNYTFRALSVGFIAGVLVGGLFILKSDLFFRQIEFLREYQAPGLRRWGESFVSTFLFQVHPFITIAAAVSLYEALRKKDLRFLIVSWLVLLILIFQIRRSRYILVVFPMLTLMASYGLQKIRASEIRRYIGSSIVGVSLVTAMFAYLPFLESMSMVNFQKGGDFLNSIDAEKIEVVTIPSEKSAVNASIAAPLLDIFSDKEICFREEKAFSLPFKEIEKSPLRFTWEYKNPGYYICDQDASIKYPAVVVISNEDVKMLPGRIEKKVEGYKAAGVFKASTGLFRYSPVVTVYLIEE